MNPKNGIYVHFQNSFFNLRVPFLLLHLSLYLYTDIFPHLIYFQSYLIIDAIFLGQTIVFAIAATNVTVTAAAAAAIVNQSKFLGHLVNINNK